MIDIFYASVVIAMTDSYLYGRIQSYWLIVAACLPAMWMVFEEAVAWKYCFEHRKEWK